MLKKPIKTPVKAQSISLQTISDKCKPRLITGC